MDGVVTSTGDVSPIPVGPRTVGPGHPCLVVAEAGVNHNGDVEMALDLVDGAADAGADVVKFQTFRADDLATGKAPKAAYQRDAGDGETTQREMLRRLQLPEDAYPRLIERCREHGILFLSSAFDQASLDQLDRLAVPALKIPSGELTNLPLLRRAASTGRPLIVSTGMATLEEVEDAVEAIRGAGDPRLVLLHCVSNYPTDPRDANLRAMDTLADAFEVLVGFSDHTETLAVPWAAVARGATVLEKHFTLDRSLPGPDHAASLVPDELARLVEGIRTVEASLGDGEKEPAPGEDATARAARKSIVTTESIPAGTTLQEGMVGAKRPGTGIPPAELDDIVGRTARVDIPADTVVEREMLT